MNKTQYINELKHRLQRLPADEYQSAIMYYEEYFEDAGPEHEQDVINNLGSPATVAAVLIGEFAMKMPADGTQPTTKNSMNTIWVALLAVFASPIALPITLAFGIVIMTLGIALFSVLLSFGITGFALLLSGIASAVISIICIPQGAAAALFTLGMSLMVISFGILFSLGTVALFRATFKGIANLVGHFLVKSNRKKMAKQQQYQPPHQQYTNAPPQYTDAPPPQYTNRQVSPEVISDLQKIVDLNTSIGDNINANITAPSNNDTSVSINEEEK